jgi:pyrroloquinoline quinone biosynthesis protein B
MKLVVLRGSQPHDAQTAQAPARHRRPPTRDPAPTGQLGAIALSDAGEQWSLLNVSPAVAQQLLEDPSLSEHAGLGDAEVRSIILTDAQIDHVTGLLSLRDGAPISLYCTPAVFEVLSQRMPVLQVLQRYCGVHWHVIPVAGEAWSASFRVETLPALEFTAFATDALPLPYPLEPGTPTSTGLSIALAVRDLRTGQRLFLAQGGQSLGPTELDWLRGADCVMVDDRTTWPDDPEGAPWRAHRKVLLQGGTGPETPARPAGFESAYDGMVITL